LEEGVMTKPIQVLDRMKLCHHQVPHRKKES
jgi:hypothetical protein